MQYILNRDNYRNFDILQAGKLDGRAYFIPYSDETALRKTDACTERYESDKVQVLSGEWQFKYYVGRSDETGNDDMAIISNYNPSYTVKNLDMSDSVYTSYEVVSNTDYDNFFAPE